MTFTPTEWKYGNLTSEVIPPEYGIRNVKVVETFIDDDDETNPIYKVTVKDLENGAVYTLSYWFLGTSNGAIAARGTLIQLYRAIRGNEFSTLPAPADLVGGVATANVCERTSKSGRTFPAVYEYFPAPRDVVEDNTDLDDQVYAGYKG